MQIKKDIDMKYEKLSVLFVGLIYIAVAALILTSPRFFYYWVAAVFFIQGIVSLIRAFLKNGND